MCPVCLLTTAGISILAGLITTSGLSAVAIKKTVFETSEKKRKARAERSVQSRGAAQTPKLKTQEVAR
jgi:hypothetical protein